MQPENTDKQAPTSSEPPKRDTSAQQAAVAHMTRDQIGSIYEQQAVAHESAAQTAAQTLTDESAKELPPSTVTDPSAHETYNKQHTSPHLDAEHAERLKQYHSAWQDYYQKYYERYYTGQVHQAHQVMRQHIEHIKSIQTQTGTTDDSMSEDEALYDLRQKLLTKVQESAKKVRKSRHFVPLISAGLVMLLFAFLQYNSIIFAYAEAYVTPGSIDPQNIIVDPNLSLSVPQDPRLIIPKINVDVAVDYTAKPDHDSQMAAMRNGVAYFGIPGANSKPGQFGNTPIAGHSSNDFIDSGNGKFIFARLEQLKKGDTFYLNYRGTRYTYTVRDILVVKPDEVTKLDVGTDKAMATLITCTPLGTAEKRLLVFGEQISPSMSEAAQAPDESDTSGSTPDFAGKAPTLLERLFGAK